MKFRGFPQVKDFMDIQIHGFLCNPIINSIFMHYGKFQIYLLLNPEANLWNPRTIVAPQNIMISQYIFVYMEVVLFLNFIVYTVFHYGRFEH